MQLLEKTLELLQLEGDFILKKETMKSPKLTPAIILNKIIADEGNSRITEVLKGHDMITVRKLLTLIFAEAPKPSASSHWYLHILAINGLKKCPFCEEVKDITLFSANKAMKTSGRDSWCRECMSEYRDINATHYKAIKRTHQQNNKSAYAEASARRRARKLKASPQWADLNKIKQYYKDCPEGMQVDHWAPLQGTNVCGLHTYENLQYLPIKDNISKSNHFTNSDPYRIY